MAFFEETNNEQVDNSLWVESYRPTTLENYVGNEHLKTKVAGYLEAGDVPHLLLYGRAGTGKTTLAKLIVKSMDCDYMVINASDENNVETVRNKVKGLIVFSIVPRSIALLAPISTFSPIIIVPSELIRSKRSVLEFAVILPVLLASSTAPGSGVT